MNQISVLSQETIDKIAAGEVVERPASIVKELVENAVDAGANAITVEIKNGGISLIRITDNGSGIPGEQVRVAFLRHATSKIRTVEDLLTSGTLGFRGEALSSIAAVCQVEMISKTAGSITGIRYIIEGGAEKSLEEIGAPEGTTFLVRNLFYHTPARKKFLKSAATEAGYVSDLIERMALSNPQISFKFINNNETKLHTSGNCNVKDIIYSIYGREIAANVVKIEPEETQGLTVSGFIGKPVISRGNRNYENYFVNGRYVKSAIIAKAIEDAYKPFLMNHRYPFTALSIQIDTQQVDVNVHPTKMEVRFADRSGVYEKVYQTVRDALAGRELIPEFHIDTPTAAQQASEKKKQTEVSEKPEAKRYPEPFEKIRSQLIAEADSPYEVRYPHRLGELRTVTGNVGHPATQERIRESGAAQQLELFEEKLLDEKSRKRHKLIGQLFDTYWLVEFEEKLFIIDQHAAHEKVLYERFMEKRKKKQQTSQQVTPPVIITLTLQEEERLRQHLDEFTSVGFEISHFGGRDYAISAVPDNLYGVADRTLFTEMLDGLTDLSEKASAEAVLEKIASMSCKAAVKGNSRLSVQEADALIGELLTLENPYNCPHGRPTIIAMTKYELEKKFKRIV
ncbi:MAG: DNA mismatch repair endonuclease MutL [Lachnospiraceae bacterium]|uniref:DNA mismatch repair endonuclease MutL n=1 Tax=Parablautia sp. Marseille-Q6255 TaxID=3039593 RepID=UPI0024BCE796|nr:DNA mismatch repair endonuclease MutL [Parablautia sp. Marseille-Q6255]